MRQADWLVYYMGNITERVSLWSGVFDSVQNGFWEWELRTQLKRQP